MDIGLPDMIGYDVARRMRQSGLDGHLKLVAITGYGQAQDERRAIEAGFDLHLTKPVSADLLRERSVGVTPGRDAAQLIPAVRTVSNYPFALSGAEQSAAQASRRSHLQE